MRRVASGWVGILTCELHFPEAHSLKEKRHHLRSAKAQLQNRVGASVAEVDHHDVWQRARITAAVRRARAPRGRAAARRGRALAARPGVGGRTRGAALGRSARISRVAAMHAAELIERKRNGEELSAGEVREFVAGYVRGDVPDYQAAAFLMAVWFRGLTSRGDVRPDRRDGGEWRDRRPRGSARPPRRRQALDGRSRRQDHDRASGRWSRRAACRSGR